MSARRSDVIRLPLPAASALQAYVSYEEECPNWAVIYVHGFGSTRTGQKSEALEAACARRGWTFASFDFRGHGESTGTLLDLRGSGLLDDLEALRHYLASRGIQRLCPVGSSMGGWASAWFTLRHPQIVPACVVLAPAFDFIHRKLANLTTEEQAQWRDTGRLRVQSEWINAEIGYGLVEEVDLFPLEGLAAGFSKPLLILHGMKDDTVPYQGSLSLIERAANPAMELHLFKDGDHRLLSYSGELAEMTCGFFARHIRQ